MKRRPWRPSVLFLIENSRRNETKQLFLGISFLLLGGLLYPLETDIKVTESENGTLVSLFLIDSPEHLVMDSLYKGTRSEIQFQIRFYRIKKGISGIFMDTLLEEIILIQEARMEEYNDQFIIAQAGETRAYTREEDLLDSFMKLTDFPVPAEYLGEDIYILARIKLCTIKLLPPLTILNLFLPETRITTPWTRFALWEDTGSEP